MIFQLAFVLVTSLAAPLQETAPACATWQECRQQALQAADAADYERFHDLAWRAVQKGPRNDRDLMVMLARAQSLSGRPGDALVMLERLAALGVFTDAATSDDFRRVRALPGWAAFGKRVADLPPPPGATAFPPAGGVTHETPAPAAAGSGATAEVTDKAATRVPRPSARKGASAGRAAPTGRPLEAAPLPEAAAIAAAPAPVETPEAAAPVLGDAADAIRFTTLSFTPAGLAYDRVSNRFIVGDHDERKLTVVDEASQRVANLAGARSAGFGMIGALEIDPREGDLWVVSSPAGDDGPAAGGAVAAATLHKLQLISGRVLYAIALDPALGPATFVDVAVTPHSSVLVLDAAGRRVFAAPPRARHLDLAMQLEVDAPSSLAPRSDSVVYVAHRDGLARVDLETRRVRQVAAAKGVSLSGFTRVRWHRGALLAVQPSGDGTYTVLKLKLDGPGQRVTGVDVLDRGLRMADPTAAALAGDVLFYLAALAAPDSGGTGAASPERAETIVRRVTVK